MDLQTNNINEVMFGFFIDQTDGTTERNSETITNSDIRVHKYGASAFADKHSGGGSFISNATYLVRFDSTDVNTPGPLLALCHKTSCLPVKMEFNVLTEAEWANKYGTARYATGSMLTSVQTVADSILGTLNSVKIMTSYIYSFGALTSMLTSVQGATDSINATVGSILTHASYIGSYGALTSQLTSVQLVVDAGGAGVTTSQIWEYTDRQLTESVAVNTWAVATRSLTDSVARTSQLTSVQTVVDSVLGTLNSVKLMTSYTYSLGARISQLTSVQSALASTPADVWAVATRTLSTGGVASIASAVWDESLTAATHNVANSGGRRLRTLDTNYMWAGTCQAGSIANTIILDAGASSTDGWYDPAIVIIDSGTGAGQCRRIIDYVGASRTCIVNKDWRVTPNATSTFIVVSDSGELALNEGQATSATANTMVLNTHAKTTNDTYNGCIIAIVSGTGRGQTRVIIDYDGASKTAYISEDWVTQPVAGTGYYIVPGGRSHLIPDAVSDIWTHATRALTDSVARTSQLTSVQSAIVSVPSDVWAVSTRTLSSGGVNSIASAVWDEPLTTASHNVATSSGKRLRTIATDVTLIGTSPGTGNTSTRIQLAADASATDEAYDPSVICITAGMGAGQTRQIWEYDGVNKYAYVNREWKIIPDNTSEYAVIADAGNTHVNEGVAGGGSNNTITLNSLASTVDDTYNNQLVFITAGTGQDQVRKITAYNGTTKVATVDANWETNPALGSIYVILPYYNTASAGGDATAANQTLILTSLSDAKGATFDTATDSLEAIRNRGDAAWITGSGLTGANTVTLTIKDDSALNVVQAGVCVYDSLGTTFYEKKFSNASGQATFQMDDGTYKIKVNKAGYSWSDTTLIVAGATSQTITGTASIITPPADPTLCRIGIYMKYQDGTIPATVESKLEIVELPDVHGNIGYMGTAYDGTYSATTGFLYWDVIQGAIAKLYILDAGIDGTKITIPATATAEIEDLI